MIRYELKDKERQAALEKALPGFEEALQNGCKYQFNDPTSFVNVIIRNGKGGYECLAGIQKNAILVKETYDPKKWNKYPEVTPPEGALMRVEGVHEGRIFHRSALYSESGSWFEETGTHKLKISVQRFRPWNEEAAK